MLRLHDSAQGRVVELGMRDAGRVSMYVCGPTVYELPHIGHGRAVLTWDVIRRWFAFNGLEVTHVANVTDVDDNIITKATNESRTEAEVAAQYEEEWWRAMDALGALRPARAPHATEFIERMVELVAELVASGHAYRTSDGVYMDTATVPDYGLLAGQPLDSLRAGARVESIDEKRSPLDFAVWKAAKPGEPAWPAPFGEGRPGWHTECVAMSLDLLGEGFDLHCGGQDLRFPHHENERAQAVALSKEFARHWVHHGWVEIEGVKMSRSLRNFTSLTDLLTHVDPRAYRLLVLRAHYRAPIEVTPDTLADAEKALARLDAVARRFDMEPIDVTSELRRSDHPELEGHRDVVAAFAGAIDDDFDSPRAVALLFDLATKANSLADGGDEDAGRATARLLWVLAGSLGLAARAPDETLDARSDELARARDEARARGDFAEADRLRDELVALGFVVEDGAGGTKIRRA